MGVDDSLLESAARCLDMNSVRALSELQLDDAARARLDVLAQKANEGQFAPEEADEYERFIDVSDIISTLRGTDRQLRAKADLSLRRRLRICSAGADSFRVRLMAAVASAGCVRRWILVPFRLPRKA